MSGGPKVPLLLPAPDREGCIFGLARQKNSIRTTGANKECLKIASKSIAFGSGENFRGIWDILYFYSLGA